MATDTTEEQLARLQAEVEGLRIALTWLAPFVQMDHEDREAALQGALDEVQFAAGAGKLSLDQTASSLTAATGVLTQAGAFCSLPQTQGALS